MKLIFTAKIIFFAALFFTPKAFLAQALSDSVSVVISPGTNNSATISSVKSKIKALTKVNYVGYCSNHNVFMLYIDTNHHGTRENFYSTLIKSTGITSLLLKEGSLEDIKADCEFNDPQDYDKNKKLSGY